MMIALLEIFADNALFNPTDCVNFSIRYFISKKISSNYYGLIFLVNPALGSLIGIGD